MKANLKLKGYMQNGCSQWSLTAVLLNVMSKMKLLQQGERKRISVGRKNPKAKQTTLSLNPDLAKMGRFVGGKTSWEERQQQTQEECLKEPSSLEKGLESRLTEQWLQVPEEAPEQGQ